MTTRTSYGLRAALVAVAALGWWTGANAQMTTAGTSITNRASVNYSVGGLPQAVIESSPTGNTTPGLGAGANTAFLVDNMVNLTVAELGGLPTVVTPGTSNAVLAFTVVNTGNSPQGYQLTVSEEIGTLLFGGTDNAQFGLANLVIRVDEDPSSGSGTGNDTYDGTEAATAINILNPSASITVFVVAPTVPLTLINGNFTNINLQARTAVPNTSGGTLLAASLGANLPTTIEVLFADTNGFDGMENDNDQFAIVTAGLTITKTQTVLDDPFGSASPRAIPGAQVEYVITIANTSTTTAAQLVSLSDPVPANTALFPAQYAGEDVGISGGVVATCTADASDADTDGCGIAAGLLTVGSGVIGNVAASSSVTVRFQVLIN